MNNRPPIKFYTSIYNYQLIALTHDDVYRVCIEISSMLHRQKIKNTFDLTHHEQMAIFEMNHDDMIRYKLLHNDKFYDRHIIIPHTKTIKGYNGVVEQRNINVGIDWELKEE